MSNQKNFEQIIHDEGKLDLGGTTVLCHVTERKKRLLSAREMQEALQLIERKETASGTRLGRFWAQKSLSPLFSLVSDRAMLEPVRAKYGNQVIIWLSGGAFTGNM